MSDGAMPELSGVPEPCLRLLAFLAEQPKGIVLDSTLPENLRDQDAITLCKHRHWVRPYGAAVLDAGWEVISQTGPGLAILPAGRAALAEHRLRAAETSLSAASDRQPSHVPDRPSDAAPPDRTSVTNKQLTPAEQRAYTAYRWAIEHDPTIESDRGAWDCLAARPEPPVPLPPSFDTFRHQLSAARAKRGELKHNPRAGRATGSAVIRKRDV
jgi:hypothetical protein